MLEIRGREIRTSPVDEQCQGYQINEVSGKGGVMLRSGS
jgi:hypothetical protein